MRARRPIPELVRSRNWNGTGYTPVVLSAATAGDLTPVDVTGQWTVGTDTLRIEMTSTVTIQAASSTQEGPADCELEACVRTTGAVGGIRGQTTYTITRPNGTPDPDLVTEFTVVTDSAGCWPAPPTRRHPMPDLRRRDQPSDGRDSGFTLIEMLVSMVVFGISITMVYSALILVQRQVAPVEGSAAAAGQVRQALAQIDRQVRSGNVLYSPENEREGQPDGTVGCQAVSGATPAPACASTPRPTAPRSASSGRSWPMARQHDEHVALARLGDRLADDHPDARRALGRGRSRTRGNPVAGALHAGHRLGVRLAAAQPPLRGGRPASRQRPDGPDVLAVRSQHQLRLRRGPVHARATRYLRTDVMTSLRPRPRVRWRDDDGVALIVSIALIGLVGVLMLTILVYALGETRASGRDRQRASSVTAAEGQLDVTLAQIQNSRPLRCPADTQPSVASQQSAADVVDIVVDVTYYDAAGNPVDCVTLTSGVATEAKVVSTGTSQPLAGQAPAQRKIETLVRLTPTFQTGLQQAIFGNAGVSLKATVRCSARTASPMPTSTPMATSPAPRAATRCTRAASTPRETPGSPDPASSRSMSTPPTGCCSTAPARWAGASWSARQRRPGCGAHRRSAGPDVRHHRLDRLRHERQQVRAGTGRGLHRRPTTSRRSTGTHHASGVGGCRIRQHRHEPDQLHVDQHTNNQPTQWLLDNANDPNRGPTVLVTPCRLELSKNAGTIQLADDLVIFAAVASPSSAASPSAPTALSSGASTSSSPTTPASQPCDIGIKLDNRVTIESTVDDLLYTPCNWSRPTTATTTARSTPAARPRSRTT